MSVESCGFKSGFQNIVGGTSRHALGALPVSRWEERTVVVYGVVSFPVPSNEIVNRLLAVSVDGNGTADFATFLAKLTRMPFKRPFRTSPVV